MPFLSRIKKEFGFNRGTNELDKTDRGEVVPIATNRPKLTVDCKMTPSSSPDKENELNCIDNVAYSTVVPKKVMESSELHAEDNSGRGTKSPSSARGRKGSDMKYSSASPPTRQARVPSAWTISDRCFANGESSSASSPETSFADSYDEQFELYTLDENEASPESRAIIDEMDQIYQSLPMPESYLMSPPKKLQLLPDIVLPSKQTSMSEKVTVPKKNMDSSELLVKQGGREQRGGLNKDGGVESSRVANEPFATRIAGAKTAYDGPRRNVEETFGKGKGPNMNGNRRNSSAPNDSRGISAPREWDMPSEKDTSSMNLTPSTAVTTKRKPLTVQREEEQRNQRVKDAKSSSNERDGRRNLDKRTARLRFADAFTADIMQHRQRQPYLNCGTNHSDKSGSQIQDRGVNGVSIAVRKRPMFDYELDRGDYDVVSIDNTTEMTHDITTVHNCVMHADMKRMYMKPTSYPVTAAFDEHCCDDDIYRHIAEPLVIDAANDGVATILMYGQTGCGKSHTMSGIETRASQGLFQAIDFKFACKPQNDRPMITIQFVELCGSKVCNDLLVKNSGEVKLVDAEDGSVHLLNATSIEVKSPEELLGQIMLAKGRRATEATDMNGVSSRSHAVCQIEIKCKQPGSNRGLLTLIDCAGSERSHDSMYHNSDRQKESAEINASLYSLKECIRARANKNGRIPFRSSSLTRILKESFERDGARLCVIACVAPNATDTEHTMETLKTVAGIVGVDDQIKEEKAHEVSSHLLEAKPTILPPSGWDHEHLKKFLALKKMERVLLTEKHDGKLLMKMSVPQMRAQLFDDRDKELAQKLFDLLRKENDRVTAIQRKERAILKKERKERV
ncbi:hypothetical protein ACHAXA_000667 [Cyclostephanos tholiformis]|uniref:Kinesin motor domain-containing protein n=1 Tax=Cyclostephanos tholiformis TaxID=382380 RepID=A0ABD3SCH2_9STRA